MVGNIIVWILGGDGHLREKENMYFGKTQSEPNIICEKELLITKKIVFILPITKIIKVWEL